MQYSHIVSASLIIACAASGAVAQNPGTPAQQPLTCAAFIATMDADRDGVIIAAEQRASAAAR